MHIVGILRADELDDQLLGLDIDAFDMSVNETSVVCRFGRLEMISNCPRHQGLDFRCWYSFYRSGALGLALEHDGREIVSILNASLSGMTGSHSIAAVIEDAAAQQGLRFHSRLFMIACLLVQLGLDGLE
jgi:hypothetical protein